MMSVYRLFHALSTGAATFGLNPVLPNVLADVAHLKKTPLEALAGDATKLREDFHSAIDQLAEECQHRGQSIETQA